MADLGTISAVPVTRPQPLTHPVTEYDVIRGRYLGAVTVADVRHHATDIRGPITNYIVRQLKVVYRQLWPTHGQRFPQ